MLDGGIVVMIYRWTEKAFSGREIFYIHPARSAICRIEFLHEYLEASLERQSGLRFIGVFCSLINNRA